ncbi:MAG: S-methyl-5'-thioadenosine phosphorylase [Candidatus Omnitrophota bacterium]|jgi:5'-methylthioadenosine phosphorylase|nr:MAG: S-methyl-5'-thioadenosine phosphorylase [Candidatus Omnitrophota bacterium]
MTNARIGIIGGSGVYDLDGVEYHEKVDMWTPYGSPSDHLRLGRFAGRELVFLPRHGRTHKFNPTHVPYAANIYAMKKMNVEWILSVNAVGSLRLEMKPQDFVIPDQLIDRTKSRINTFFDPIAVHVGFADPFCSPLRQILIASCRECKIDVHEKGTYVCMEGPAFSTRAESNLYRSWNADLIGMTALPEAKLAREAEICYGIVAAVTDYDCWHEENVEIEMVIQNLKKNSENLKRLIKTAIPKIPERREPKACECVNAMQNAVLTQPEDFPKDRREVFEFFMSKYR